MFKPEIYKSVEDAFRQRLVTLEGIDLSDKKKLHSKKILAMQAEFFVGAMAALAAFDKGSSSPPSWVIAIMPGRSIIHV